MSIGGTAAYDDLAGVPDRVAAAAKAASEAGFEYSCQPAQGKLLSLLAAGVPPDGVLGETGTGYGVGLAWLATAAGPDTRLVSVENDPERHAIARALFADDERVTILRGDWADLAAHGPFDLLVLDGGAKGSIRPREWLTFGGTAVIDDFTPFDAWPPQYAGQPDAQRLWWFEQPELLTTELRLAPDLSTIVARYVSLSA